MTRKLKQLSIALALLAVSAGAAYAQEAETGVVINGVRWATRNLDVGGTFVENPEDYGALFQWGRLADGHEDPASATTYTKSSTDTPGNNKFIFASSSPYDWRSPQKDALWNAGTEDASVKADNDPSPAGWRVPTNTELATLLDDTKVTKAWDAVKKGYTFTDKENPENSIFLPAAGFRNGGSGGMVSNAGKIGVYWGSTLNGIYARYLSFSEGGADRFGGSRANGYSLRCVATEKYFVVTFDSNEGSTVSPATVIYNTTVTKPADPTRTEYTFAGWYIGSELFDFATPITENITLTAHWVIIAPPPTAISATEQQPLSIYPNPVTNGELRIESGELKAGEPITVYNLSGAQVAVYQASGGQTTINISHLPRGAYLVKVGSESELIIKN